MNVLVIAAHPDDVVLGCGATLARLTQEGATVTALVLCQGSTSRLELSEQIDESVVKNLRDCSQEAARMLGLKSIKHLDFADNRLDEAGLLAVVKAIEAEIREVNPAIVFTQHGGDLNNDHALVFRASMIALRPMCLCQVESILAYEVPSSTEWAFQRFEPIFRANIFYQIETTLPLKLRAMAAFKTETRDFPHPRSSQSLRNYAERWGAVIGMNAAEAFELIWERKR